MTKGTKIFLLILSIFLMLSACSSDETPKQAIVKPNYFPDTVGSSWVYQNSDGIKWSQEVNEHKAINNSKQLILKYTPPLTDTDIDFFKPTSMHITQKQILYDVGEKIEHYIQTVLPTYVEDEFSGLDIQVKVEHIFYPKFIFLTIPLAPHLQWKTLNVDVSGNFFLQDLIFLQIPFDVNISVNGEVISEDIINTIAGKFDHSYQIAYQTEITHTIFSKENTLKLTNTIWYAPHVGIVKIEDDHSVVKLTEYTLVPTIVE